MSLFLHKTHSHIQSRYLQTYIQYVRPRIRPNINIFQLAQLATRYQLEKKYHCGNNLFVLSIFSENIKKIAK